MGPHSRIDGCCSLELPAAAGCETQGRSQLISVNSQLLAKDSQLASSSADINLLTTQQPSDIKLLPISGVLSES